jgi:hypothetical protein
MVFVSVDSLSDFKWFEQSEYCARKAFGHA